MHHVGIHAHHMRCKSMPDNLMRNLGTHQHIQRMKRKMMIYVYMCTCPYVCPCKIRLHMRKPASRCMLFVRKQFQCRPYFGKAALEYLKRRNLFRDFGRTTNMRRPDCSGFANVPGCTHCITCNHGMCLSFYVKL